MRKAFDDSLNSDFLPPYFFPFETIMHENSVSFFTSFGQILFFGFSLKTVSFDHVVYPVWWTIVVRHLVDYRK